MGVEMTLVGVFVLIAGAFSQNQKLQIALLLLGSILFVCGLVLAVKG
jgi:hypothetical protein